MLDPVRRRNWLFAKALETVPLSEALALAQAAEAFITATMEQSLGVTSAPPFEIPPTTDKPPQRAVPTFAVQNDQPLATTEALAELTSLASIDDVIRYLRQCGDVVLDETEGADELLALANLKRAEKGLPPFTLLPAAPGKAAQRGKADQAKNVAVPSPSAAPRSLNARERAELARNVIAMPAE